MHKCKLKKLLRNFLLMYASGRSVEECFPLRYVVHHVFACLSGVCTVTWVGYQAAVKGGHMYGHIN